ncbi:unnamed protein product [Acanthoscelides obtectus]|nr:unnamed protein product [Acanthoscelides obtectus]CAK1665688.1 hypothetical protein AOBTE_LOCUS24919 [Acanthoscelides obtectus]
MLSNHLALPSTSYSDQQSNSELEFLRATNRELSETLASARQDLAIAHENTNCLKTKYLNLHVKYSRLENLVKANLSEFSNFLSEPRPQHEQTRRNSRNHSLGPLKPHSQKTIKTQLVFPTVNGHVIQVPRITLNRFDDMEWDSNRSPSGSNTSLAPSVPEAQNNFSDGDTDEGSGNTDAEAYISGLISAQENITDGPNAPIPDNMENMRIVLERLPANLSLGHVTEQLSNSDINESSESSPPNAARDRVSQPTNTLLLEMVDTTTETDQSASGSHLNSTVRGSREFSSISQLTAIRMLGLELSSSVPKSPASTIRRRPKSGRKSSPTTASTQQKRRRKRQLNSKTSSPTIRRKRSDDKIVMVLLDRKQMSKLLMLRNPVVRLRRMFDNKTESKSLRKQSADTSNGVDSRTTLSSEFGSQTKGLRKKTRNNANDVVSEDFIKRNLSVKVTKLTSLE